MAAAAEPVGGSRGIHLWGKNDVRIAFSSILMGFYYIPKIRLPNLPNPREIRRDRTIYTAYPARSGRAGLARNREPTFVVASRV